jgi:phosphoserine aminotransferase
MKRVYNFSAGPSMLPDAVLQQAQQDMLDWQSCGMSVMEISHRGKLFSTVAQDLEHDLRALMAIPNHYHVLFLQGGASAQFSFIPQNILGNKNNACYIKTGAWSEKAIKDAQAHCHVHVSASGEQNNFTHIPDITTWDIDKNAAYLHYTSNETIHGVEFHNVPDAQGLPLICDMSSNILSRPIDVSQFGLIYAGSQKNMGPAGVTVIIIREDLLGHCLKTVPPVFNYAQQVENQSMLNTPVTYSWYLMGLVLKWLKSQGGVHAIEEQNRRKADKLYQFIDQSDLYHNPVSVDCRSRMNIPFVLTDNSLDKLFLNDSEANGLCELKGHRAVGGMRASIYNAMPESGIDALISFMTEFQRTH